MSKMEKYACDNCNKESDSRKERDWINITTLAPDEANPIYIYIGFGKAVTERHNIEFDFCSITCLIAKLKLDKVML